MLTSLYLPIAALMCLTLAVWLLMYWRRLSYIYRQRISPQQLASFEKIQQLLPESVNLPAHNFRNLFELPILFYALAIAIELLAMNNPFYLVTAWLFVIGRFLHSGVQCSYNQVTHRFLLYILSSIALWAMLVYWLVELLIFQV
ncbi:MAPEG family protein [Motilimonas sp. KMU-193]|uniref:MAPEG family protein n=1 Tax=Motilimonas sp. KMU-193 TaxID=3388668 RepID=UPI00396AF53B